MYRKDRSQRGRTRRRISSSFVENATLGPCDHRVVEESKTEGRLVRACTTERRPHRLPSYVMKYDDPNLINHGERAKPSLLPSTAKARAPMQSDSSKNPLYELLRYASAMRIPCKESPSGPRPSPPLRHEAATQSDSRRRREHSHLEEEEQCQAISWAMR